MSSQGQRSETATLPAPLPKKGLANATMGGKGGGKQLSSCSSGRPLGSDASEHGGKLASSSPSGEETGEAPSAKQPPVKALSLRANLSGTLTHDADKNIYTINGTWSYGKTEAQQQQRSQHFELTRALRKRAPFKESSSVADHASGVYSGWFDFDSQHVREQRVIIQFAKSFGTAPTTYNIKGSGKNRFGAFTIQGRASPLPSTHSFKIEFEKDYGSVVKSQPDSYIANRRTKRKMDHSEGGGNDFAVSEPPAKAAKAQDQNFVTRSEFNRLVGMMTKMQNEMKRMNSLLAKEIEKRTRRRSKTGNITPVPPTRKIPQERSQKHDRKVIVPISPQLVEEEEEETNREVALTLVEKEKLIRDVESLDASLLSGVLQIIRESGSVSNSDEDVDLDIDELDVSTQRKLQRFVEDSLPSRKKQNSKSKGKKQHPKQQSNNKKRRSQKSPSSPKPKKQNGAPISPISVPDEIVRDQKAHPTPENEQKQAPPSLSSLFAGFGEGGFDSNESDGEEGDANTKWNMNLDKSSEEIADWAKAQNHARQLNALEADRDARTQRLTTAALDAHAKRLAHTMAVGQEQMVSKQKEEEEKRKKLRNEAMEQFRSIEQTVDLEQPNIVIPDEGFGTVRHLSCASNRSSDFGF